MLDEVSEMRIDLQPKLLRVLQEREFERVGGTHPIRTDVRIVATTNRDLAACVAEGSFRQDLFYRLNVFPIRVPPLRERLEDVPALAFRFASAAASDAHKPFDGISHDALESLQRHRWPGNVRELQHAMERAVILAKGATLERHLFDGLDQGPDTRQPVSNVRAAGGSAVGQPTLDLETVERETIARALQAAGGNRMRASELLGIDVRTLRRKLNGAAPQADRTP